MAGEPGGGRARSVVGVLDTAAAAEDLLSNLYDMGVGPEEVSVMTRDGAKVAEGSVDTRSSILTGSAATGAAFGGLLGGLAGWMISIGAIAIPGVLVPGVGLVFGAGALASLLTGIAVGAAAGGLIGALLGLGVPGDEAKQYEQNLKSGRTLVTVNLTPDRDENSIVDAFANEDAHDVRVYEAPAPVSTRKPGSRSTTPVENTYPVDTSAAEVTEPTSIEEQEVPVGDASAHTDALGSGAEGGLGTGDALGEEPTPDVETTTAATAAQEPRSSLEEQRTAEAEQGVEQSKEREV